LKPLLLDGIDLPDVVWRFGLDPGRTHALRASWGVDSFFLEGALESANGRDQRGIEAFEQFDPDAARSPGGVSPLELAGAAQDVRGMPPCGLPTLVVTNGQAVLAAMAESAPEGTNGLEGQVEVGGDARQGLVVEVTANDLLAGRQRNGARHG
jgi:hypothetical protein